MTCSAKRRLGTLVLLQAVACGGNDGPRTPRQSLAEAREEWTQAIAAGDLERIFSFWTDDIVIYPVAEPEVRGKDAVREYVLRNRRDRGLSPRMTPIEISESESGDMGHVIGTYEWIDAAGTAHNPGRYVTLWRRNENGQWRCFLEIHSPLPDESVESSDAAPQPTG